MSIKELSAQNSYTDGFGSLLGPIDIYAQNMYANTLSCRQAIVINSTGSLSAPSIAATETITTPEITAGYYLTTGNRYVEYLNVDSPTVTTNVFPCGVVRIRLGVTGQITLPSGAQLDLLLGTTNSPGPMCWLDVVNDDPTTDFALSFQYLPENPPVLKGIPKAQSTGKSTYTRFWFVKPAQYWSILSAEA